MRGRVDRQQAMWFTIQPEDFVPADHPLRAIKKLVDAELVRLEPVFAKGYAGTGRRSVPPERLIKASLLQALYSIRSERQLCEQIHYNMLFRWFLDMKPDDVVFAPTTFTKNRDRFAEHGFMAKFFEGTVAQAIAEGAASEDHFSVDGTLIQSWASLKSFRPKDEDDDDRDSNGWADFKGRKRSNETHESKTDPEARLHRKGSGQEAKLSHSLHALVENRNGLVLAIEVEEASGTAERRAARAMLTRVREKLGLRPKTLAADKGYDDGQFLHDVEFEHGAKPHVPTRDGPIKDKSHRGDARRRARRRKRSLGYQLSEKKRRLVEQPFGWLKGVAGLRRTRFVERWKTRLCAEVSAAAFNLLRLAKLLQPEPAVAL